MTINFQTVVWQLSLNIRSILSIYPDMIFVRVSHCIRQLSFLHCCHVPNQSLLSSQFATGRQKTGVEKNLCRKKSSVRLAVDIARFGFSRKSIYLG